MTSKIIKDKVKTKIHSQDSIPSFIRKTYDILEERKFPDVIDWNPEGTALVIKKPSEFCQKVLPAYFKHNNLTSFVRQLNMYNFHKRRTQNIDHVYYHELFQKGKKHLLKEIKRKNHENNNNSDKASKGIENIEPAQAGKDVPTLMYENQVLRRLYNDANTKVALLESQIRDLSGRNQSLWTQLCQSSDANSLKCGMNIAQKQASLTQEQLPMTFGDISIPPLKLISDGQPQRTIAKTGMNSILNIAEVSAETTEASHSPPSLQNMTEGGVYPNGLLHVPGLTITPQISQLAIRPMMSDLFASRAEMSVGQLFEAWNQENQPQELITFADQQPKFDKTPLNIQALFSDPANVLGKRLFDENQLNNVADSRFNIPEPLTKRSDLSIFNRRSMMISNGTEDREFLKAFIRRESSMGDDFDPNTGVDLMDFNHPFLNSTKASS